MGCSGTPKTKLIVVSPPDSYFTPTSSPETPSVNERGVNTFGDLETYIVDYRAKLASCNKDKRLIKDYLDKANEGMD